MDHQISIPFLSSEYLNFEQICEKVTTKETADQLYHFILNLDNYFDVDFLATALYHCGFEEQFTQVLEEKYDYKQKNHFKKMSVLPVRLGLYYLQKVADGIDVEQNLEKAHQQHKEAVSVDPKSPFVLILQCFASLLKNKPEFYRRALDLASVCSKILKTPQDQATYFVEMKPFEALGHAISYYQNENYEEAFKLFCKFLRKYSKSAPLVRLAIGQTLLAQHKTTEATYAFQRVLEIDPENVDALTALGIIKFNEDTSLGIEGARNYLTRALKINPNYAPALLLQADFLFNSQSYRSKAEKIAKRALKKATTDKMKADAIFIVAQSAHLNGDIERAKHLYEQVILFNPTHSKANFYLGLFESKKNPKQTIECIEKVHQKLYDIFEANAVLGLSYSRIYQEGDQHTQPKVLKQAVKYLKLASKQKSPNSREMIKVLSTLGWLRIKSLKFNKAEQHYTTAVELYENSLNESEQKSDDNSKPTENVIYEGLNFEQLLTFTGIAQFQNGKFDKALQTFQRAEEEFFKYNPEGKASPVLRFNMALCKEEMNKFNEARNDYKQLHEDYPQFPEPLLRISALAVRDTRPNIINTEAKEALETIVSEIDQNNVAAWLELANVNARSRQLQEAKKIMQKTQEKAADGDGFIYSTVSMGNYFLESAQNKDNPSDRANRLKYAQNYYVKALKHNHYCVAAANGLSICWLLSEHTEPANNYLRIVKDNRPEQSSTWENLGLSYMHDQKYQQAYSLFESANKKFFDKTDVNLLLQSFYASKGDKRWDNCLQVAETLCQLRPENETHWYLLASSLHKVVITQSSQRNIQGKNIKVSLVERWMAQLKKCASLFTSFQATNIGQTNVESINQKIEAVNQHLERLEKLKETAKECEQRKREQAELLARNLADDAENHPGDIDGPQ